MSSTGVIPWRISRSGVVEVATFSSHQKCWWSKPSRVVLEPQTGEFVLLNFWWDLKVTNVGVCVLQRPKKEGVRGFGACTWSCRKFYWWVVIRSRAWGLVILIVWTSILSSGLAFYLKDSYVKSSPGFLPVWFFCVIISLCHLYFRYFTWYDCLIVLT